MRIQGHILNEDGTLTLARRLPLRWDLCVEYKLTAQRLSRRRLALRIRQDLWRTCQSVKGFLPLVSIREERDAYQLSLGATLMAPAPKTWIEARIHTLLENPERIARWCRFARRQEGSC